MTKRSSTDSPSDGDARKDGAEGPPPYSVVFINRRPLAQSGSQLSRIGRVSSLSCKGGLEGDRTAGERGEGRGPEAESEGSTFRNFWSPQIIRGEPQKRLRSRGRMSAISSSQARALSLLSLGSARYYA